MSRHNFSLVPREQGAGTGFAGFHNLSIRDSTRDAAAVMLRAATAVALQSLLGPREELFTVSGLDMRQLVFSVLVGVFVG